MSVLQIKPKYECRWDLVSLGELLLRLDAGNERLHIARQLQVFESGSEYNVARNLRKVFNLRTALFTALTKNPLGRLLEDLIMQGGVDASQIVWREADSISPEVRNGICFTERGCGLRPPSEFFDRVNSAAALLQPGDFDWNWVFGEYHLRWFHTSLNYALLSKSAAKVAAVAMQFARKYGAIISFDLNIEELLLRTPTDKKLVEETIDSLLPFVDVIFGMPNRDSKLSNFDEIKFADSAQKLQNKFENIKIIASLLREVKSASYYDLSAVCYSNYQTYKARFYSNVEVYDRAGSRDAFTTGLIYSFLSNKNEQFAVDCGAAHAVLSMTTPGDSSTSTLSEVEVLMSGTNTRVQKKITG